MTASTRTFGLEAIAEIFQQAKDENRAAFLPYFPIGYPDYDTSLDAIAAMAEVGVDGFEIGVPFSDPLADGPTVQAATQKSLENGTTVKTCLHAVHKLRERGITQPMLMMSYANPLVAYGSEQFVIDAKAAGADGLIVPDLPPEEAAYFADACAREGMALVFFLAPTSNDARIQLVAENARGFIYVVSLTGITGARDALPADLSQTIANIRRLTDTPLVLGFGISTPEHARMMNSLVDGFIVGSAMVRAAKEGVDAVGKLAAELRNSLG
ncbi:MAG: tryptophan synthase subunit alpha [Anaerolineae bacterium]|nr:tryptophan synthase subunit alpha [Anaerolineae bacterium]